MINSNNGFTATESISLSQELALLGVADTPFSSLLLSRGVEKAMSTVHTWKEKSLATDGETDAVEGADTLTFQQSSKREISNILQIFKRAVSISGTAEAMQRGKFSEEVSDRLYELKLKLESVLINGQKTDGSTGDYIRRMSGIIEFASAENAETGANVEELIKLGMKNLWEQKLTGGTYWAFVNADVKDKIDAIYKDSYSYQHKTTNFGIITETINTNFGIVNVVLSREIPADKIVLFNDSYLNLAELRPTVFEPLAKVGDSTKGQIICESTLVVRSPKAVAVLTVDTP